MLIAWSIIGLSVGLACISCGVYLAARNPNRLKSNAFAKRLNLHLTPRSYWVQCVAIGAFFTSIGLMASASASDGFGGVIRGWESEFAAVCCAVAAAAVILVLVLQVRAS